MAKPTVLPRWAEVDEQDPITGAENKVEPTEEFKLSGLKRGEFLARVFVNYQFNLIAEWLEYLSAKSTEYDLTGGTEIDPDNGKYQTLSLSENTTLTETMVAGDEVYLLVTANGFTLTYPASFDWGDAGEPTLTTSNLIRAIKIGSTVYPTLEWSNT
jgi:hypothetical protein